MTDTNPENEPSMEEILASIRRIISDGEEEGDSSPAADEPAAEAPEPESVESKVEVLDPGPPPEALSAVPSGEPAEEPEEDILDLTQMVTEQGEVVDLNEAKSARGLMPAEPPASDGDLAAEPLAEDDLEVEVTVDDVTRAVEALAQSMAEEENEENEAIEAVAPPPEEPTALEVVEKAVAAIEPEPVPEPEPEELVLEAAPAVEEDGPEVELETPEPEPVELEPIELVTTEPEVPEPAAMEPEPLELETPVEEPPSAMDALAEIEAVIDPDQAAAIDPAPAAEIGPLDAQEDAPASADETLSEIDQILARAREAAEAQAAENVAAEAAAAAPDEVEALVAGLENAGSGEDAVAAAEPVAEEPAAYEEGADPAVMLEGIRAAVEESLGLNPLDRSGGAAAEAGAADEHAGLDVEAETEALLAGLEARVRPDSEEQDVSSRKESDLDFGSGNDAAAGSDAGLISSATAAGAIAALGDLARASRESPGERGGGTPLGSNRTLEEMVVAAIAPQLKAWLDSNLEPLVERIVREEIQRLRRRSEDY